MAGIFFARGGGGGQLRFPPGSIRIRAKDDGSVEMDPVTPELRMDLWPQWLHESLDATVAAIGVHEQILQEVAAPSTEEALADLLDLELRTSMRAITSAAFAVDAFYASVQARSPEHPDRAKWRTPGRRRTPRQAQVFETLRYHLKLRQPGAGEIRLRIRELFRYRGWAVHADATFNEPVFREDIDRGVDWHHAAFRAENAVATLGVTVNLLDVLVVRLERGSNELREWASFARERMDVLLDLYERQGGLHPLVRAEDDLGRPRRT